MGSPPLRRLLRFALLAALVICVLPSSAFAGRIWVTGHDQDFHCSLGQGCGYLLHAVDFVRGDAPVPSKPVLVLDRAGLAVPTAFNNIKAQFGVTIPFVVVDPRSAAFKTTPINTSLYSALLVASDTTCGGCDLNEATSTPDSDAINARRGTIGDFVNGGGGVLALAGASHGDGVASDGRDNYYSFIPTAVGGAVVSPPFCLTGLGKSLGLQDITTGGSLGTCPDRARRTGTRDDINCCATHNSFLVPDFTSPLQMAEFDLGADGRISGDDHPETLIAGGKFSGGQLVLDLPSPGLGRSVNVAVISGKVFVKNARSGGASLSGAHASKGSGFVRLTSPRQVRMGSLLDTRHGVVQLFTATTRAGRQQVAQLSGSIFQVLQSRRRSARGLATLSLKGGSFRSCRARGASVEAARSHRRIRRLRAKARGRFRTRGRYSAATVRGTEWTTEDRCDGTLTSVRRGVVIVRDFKRHRNIRVRAHHRYLARA